MNDVNRSDMADAAMPSARRADAFVVMGVSGSGKSTLANAIARHYGLPMIEGDEFHAPSNLAKMARGEPLTDDDRLPWLDAVAAAIVGLRESGRVPVATCSALRRAYRDRLRSASGLSLCFILIEGTFERVAAQMGARIGHFMPTVLLQSQFDILEPPQPDEWVLTVDLAVPEPARFQGLIARLDELIAR